MSLNDQITAHLLQSEQEKPLTLSSLLIEVLPPLEELQRELHLMKIERSISSLREKQPLSYRIKETIAQTRSI